jgi:hypothetical protein
VNTVFTLAQTSKSAVARVSKPARRQAAEPTWKSATQQVWKPALQITLTESKLVKPGQTKMKKYILCVGFRDFRPGASPTRLQSGLLCEAKIKA